MTDAIFRAGHILLAPGFTLLVNLVVEGSLWTWLARTCADNHSVYLLLSVTRNSSVYEPKSWIFVVYLRFSVGSWPLSHLLIQNEQTASPHMSPSLQPHCVSVVDVHSFTRTKAPTHTKKDKESCKIMDLVSCSMQLRSSAVLWPVGSVNIPTHCVHCLHL